MPTYDLSRPLETETPTYPGDPPVATAPHATFDADGYRVTALGLGSHAGTHVDAPSHTEADGRTLGEIPVETFAFDAALLDLREFDARAQIPADRLAAADPPTGAGLLVLRTGWADRWGEERYRDHPYLAPAAAEWCADRGYHVAVDAFSVDPTPSDRADDGEPDGTPAHHALLGRDRLIVENLAGLDPLPERERFELRAYPLALDADGAPVRAVGVVK